MRKFAIALALASTVLTTVAFAEEASEKSACSQSIQAGEKTAKGVVYDARKGKSAGVAQVNCGDDDSEEAEGGDDDGDND